MIRQLIGLALAIAVAASSAAEAPGSDGAVRSAPTLTQKATPNVHFIVHWLDYAGHYQLEIENYSQLGTVTGLKWMPPDDLLLSSVDTVRGGACHLTPDGGILCRSDLTASRCDGDTCYPGSGAIIITFTAKLNPAVSGAAFTNLFWGSYLNVTSLAPSLQTFPDLPLCRHGQMSTKTKPCAKQ
jgi:hypothetical protein